MSHTATIADLLAANGFRRFAMTRSGVGHLMLAGHLDDRPLDMVLDTGAAKTIIELGYCRSEGIAVRDTGQPPAPAAGAGPAPAATVHVLDGARLTLAGLPLRYDGLFAIDMTSTNQKLAMRGVDPIRAVIGQDVLRHHRAVIDYATLSLFLYTGGMTDAETGACC